jgi:RNA polymerase subunit RPABC4/transcription elongation factor Spt4
MGAFKCPKCQATTFGDSDFCPECGAPWTVECTRCGASWRFFYAYKFCPKCGQRAVTQEVKAGSQR